MSVMGPPASDRQIGYLITLYNRVHGASATYLSQCSSLPMTQRERRGGMTRAEASGYIDSLKAQLAQTGEQQA